MKKHVSFFIIAIASCILLSGCKKDKVDVSEPEKKKISIVCTMFPQYDWCREILGMGSMNTSREAWKNVLDFDLTLLMTKGSDLHNYQPTVSDLVKIQNADILIYVGGESDEWVSDALKSAKKEIRTVNLINLVDTKSKFTFESDIIFEGESEEDRVIPDPLLKIFKEDGEWDEHVWLSLSNVRFFVSEIYSAICDIIVDEEQYILPKAALGRNAGIYKDALQSLDYEFFDLKRLRELSDMYYKGIESAENTILVADRFPFRYLCNDYNLKYYAAFTGCGAESEASFQTIIFLADKLKSLNLPVVYILENSDEKIAKSVIQNSGVDAKIVRLNSMQSITEKDIKAGVTYIDLMKENLKVLSDNLK